MNNSRELTLCDYQRKNAVNDVPQGFKQWIEGNAGRIERATQRGTLPYFLKDNKTVVDGIIREASERVREL